MLRRPTTFFYLFIGSFLLLHSVYFTLLVGRPCDSWAGGPIASYVSTELSIVVIFLVLLAYIKHAHKKIEHLYYQDVTLNILILMILIGFLVWKSLDAASQWTCQQVWSIGGIVIISCLFATSLWIFGRIILIFVIIDSRKRHDELVNMSSRFKEDLGIPKNMYDYRSQKVEDNGNEIGPTCLDIFCVRNYGVV